MIWAAWQNWRDRHQHPFSIFLHALAIPLLPLAGLLAVVQLIDGAWGLWWRPVGLFLLSYLLQWFGHRIEGNDMGEVIPIKRLLGQPYIAIVPSTKKGTSEK